MQPQSVQVGIHYLQANGVLKYPEHSKPFLCPVAFTQSDGDAGRGNSPIRPRFDLQELLNLQLSYVIVLVLRTAVCRPHFSNQTKKLSKKQNKVFGSFEFGNMVLKSSKAS